MAKFVKRPVEVDAWRFNGTFESYQHIADEIVAINERAVVGAVSVPLVWVAQGVRDHTGRVQCKTPNGWITAIAGDWIVRQGLEDVYPCAPDVFAVVYRDAEPAAPAPHDHAAHGPQAHAARHVGDARTAPLRHED